MINWCTIPSGKAFREHYHQDMQEIFVVISGTAEAHAEGQSVTLTGGDAWIVDPGVRHSMSAVSSEAVVYLVLGIASGVGGKTVVTA
jgi:quercetin dioxygenase-like cupin family protein